MSIRFRCPKCARKIEIADRHAGRTVECPRCSQPMIVPAAAAPVVPAEPDVPVLERAAFDEPPERDEIDQEFPAPSDVELAGTGHPTGDVPERDELVSKPGSMGGRVADDEYDGPLVAPAKKIDFEELIDMTAMVDIVFFLLIFFLVTSMHALDSTIPMPVPDPQGAATGGAGASQSTLDGDDSQIVVRIDRNDTITVEGAEVHGPQELLFRLRDLRSGPGQPDKLLVVGSGDASHGTAVMVLDAGHEVGLEQVRLAIQDEAE